MYYSVYTWQPGRNIYFITVYNCRYDVLHDVKNILINVKSYSYQPCFCTRDINNRAIIIFLIMFLCVGCYLVPCFEMP